MFCFVDIFISQLDVTCLKNSLRKRKTYLELLKARNF